MKKKQIRLFYLYTGAYVDGKNGGDFLGGSIDGEDDSGGKFFVKKYLQIKIMLLLNLQTCAPRLTTMNDVSNYYTNGRCFVFINSTSSKNEPHTAFPLRLREYNF